MWILGSVTLLPDFQARIGSQPWYVAKLLHEAGSNAQRDCSVRFRTNGSHFRLNCPVAVAIAAIGFSTGGQITE